jgi:hypothetical protein
MKCGSCNKGPVGSEGHLDLFVHKMQGSRIQFYCRTCSTLWLRIHADTNYRWSESARELDAVPVPRPQSYPRL